MQSSPTPELETPLGWSTGNYYPETTGGAGEWPLPLPHLSPPPLPRLRTGGEFWPIVLPVVKGYCELRLLLNQGGNPTRTPEAKTPPKGRGPLSQAHAAARPVPGQAPGAGVDKRT